MLAADSMRAIARPLHGEADLDELASVLARRRLVLLGEATRGTHEFQDLRAALTRRLIARGHEVGLQASGHRIRPGGGVGHERRMLAALAWVGFDVEEKKDAA